MGREIISLMFPRLRPTRAFQHAATAVFLLFALAAVEAEGAIFRIEPAILAGEEYNDNVFLQPDNDRIAAYIAHVAPSLHLKYTTSFWDWDLNYSYDYRHYDYRYDNTNTGLIQNDSTHTINLRNRTDVIKDFFFVEMRDDYGRVSRDIRVDYTQQSPSVNQVDQNVFSLNPYVVFKAFSNTTLALGYIFQDTHYRNGDGINRVDNIEYAEATTSLSSRLTLTTGVRYTREQNGVENFNELDVYTGPRYLYAENSYVFAQIGESRFDYEINGKTTQGFWDAGINHQWAASTLALESRSFYVRDPEHVSTREDLYTASIRKVMKRTSLRIDGTYREFKDTQSNRLTATSREGQGTLMYRHTPRTNSTIGAGIQNLKDRPLGADTKIILSTLRIDHQLSVRFSLALEYRYLHSYSAEISTNNYINNRYIVELRGAFF